MLVDALVRTLLVEAADVFVHKATQLLLAQNEHMVGTFPAQTAHEPFAEGVGVGARTGVRKNLKLYRPVRF
jgi:hypothetical protein